MTRAKLSPKAKKALKVAKGGKGTATKTFIEQVTKRLAKGKDTSDLEKKLGTKKFKDMINIINQSKYGTQNFVKLALIYSKQSRVMASRPNFRAVKLSGGVTGWMTPEGKIWTKMESLDLLNSLDAVRVKGQFDDTLVNKWSKANAEQKAEISQMLSEYDWDHVWNVTIQSDERFKASSGGDRVAKRTTFLEEIHGKIDEILAR